MTLRKMRARSASYARKPGGGSEEGEKRQTARKEREGCVDVV